ncbi:MAG: hypothetical protein EG823_02445 [Actinobacteria bacterium]|nr:hypothetical protein [Actinomycetota bacterium]
MDPKWKTALAVAVGVVIGITLLGTAVAAPAVFRTVGRRATVSDTVGYPMMGQARNGTGEYGMMGRQGMMGGRGAIAGRPGMMGGQRGQAPAVNADGTCPNCGSICPSIATPETPEAPAAP